MPHIRRQLSLALLAPCLLVCALLSGCEDGPPRGESMAEGSQASTQRRLNDPLDADLENAEWGEIDVSERHQRSGRGATGRLSLGGGADATTEARPWTIVLATVPGKSPEQRQVAANALERMKQLAPGVGGARLIPTRSGFIIGYGAYADATDPQAQRDLERIKDMQVRDGTPFSGAVLSRTPSSEARPAGRMHPHDLRAARALHPNVDPLYTLQVGVWSNFDSGQLSEREVRRNAEQQCAELRAKGREAYFYHDDDQVISIVTVGLFDSNALKMDKQLKTPVLSHEVELLLREFPEHLVNGEVAREPIARNKPSLGTRVQSPKLVLVP